MALDTTLTIPSATAAEVLDAPDTITIDLRSPVEFADDHLPGASNVPLFDDDERAFVGTLYRRHGPAEAFEAARERVRAKITTLVEAIGHVSGQRLPAADLAGRYDALTRGGLDAFSGTLDVRRAPLPGGAIALTCWRGGLRSRSVALFLRELGWDRVVLMEGGYKAYRAQVRARIAAWRPGPVFVLRGLTGVGKTLVLNAIERLRPGWTIDLEGLAAHRSSILGMVGREPVSQKAFESGFVRRLARRLQGLRPPGAPTVLEGESRRVGDVVLPEPIWKALSGGVNVLLEASLGRRVDVLLSDYLERETNRAELARQLPFIEERLGVKKWGGVLTALLAERRDGELARLLLERYYDPLYRHSERGKHYALVCSAEDVRAAAARIVRWIESGC